MGVRSPQAMPNDAQVEFWSVVRRCIREFHARRSTSALSKATRLRKKIEGLPFEEKELFFHAEPFDVACRLAGHSLRVEDYLARYLEIRDGEGDRCC